MHTCRESIVRYDCIPRAAVNDNVFICKIKIKNTTRPPSSHSLVSYNFTCTMAVTIRPIRFHGLRLPPDSSYLQLILMIANGSLQMLNVCTV